MELTVSNRTIIRILVLTLGALIAIRLIADLRTELIWILTALFFALALEPAVSWLSRFLPRRSRGLAVTVVLLIAVAVLAFISIALVPPLAAQLFHLATNLPGAYSDFVKSNPGIGGTINSHLNTSSISSTLQKFSDQLLSFGGSAVLVARGIFGGIVAVSIVLLLTFFMVLEGPSWAKQFAQSLNPEHRAKYQGLLKQMHGTITGYVGGKLFMSLISVVATAIILLILRAPYAFSLALLVGVVDLIPMVGATLAAVIVCLVELVFKGFTPFVILLIFFIIYQQVENNVLQPIVFSKAVEVSPLVTTIALLVGVSLAGFVGALVAIPVAASLQLLVRFYFANRRSENAKA